MNLSQIERRFQCVDFMANYVNYKYNPHIEKIDDFKQHIYKDQMKEDAVKDQNIYGLAAYQEGDPAEIVRGSQKMSTIAGTKKSKASNISKGDRSQETLEQTQGTILVKQDGTLNDDSRIITYGNMTIADAHAKSQPHFNNMDIYKTGSGLHSSHHNQRPFTSKVSSINRGGVRTATGVRGTNPLMGQSQGSRWTMSRPLRHQQRKGAKSSHLIHRSKVNVQDLPSSDTITISDALGKYHAQKSNKLLHRPRQLDNRTIYYRAGDHMKTATESILDKSPQRPVNLMNETAKSNYLKQTAMSNINQAQEKKEQDYGNLMKQLYKIKIPDQILTIIKQTNPILTYGDSNEEPQGESLMQLINTQYIKALALDLDSNKRGSMQSANVTTQKPSLAKDQSKSKQFSSQISNNCASFANLRIHDNQANQHNSNILIKGSDSKIEISGGHENPNISMDEKSMHIGHQSHINSTDQKNRASDSNALPQSVTREVQNRLSAALKDTQSVPDLIQKQSPEQDSQNRDKQSYNGGDHPIFSINDKQIRHVETLKGTTYQNSETMSKQCNNEARSQHNNDLMTPEGGGDSQFVFLPAGSGGDGGGTFVSKGQGLGHATQLVNSGIKVSQKFKVLNPLNIEESNEDQSRCDPHLQTTHTQPDIDKSTLPLSNDNTSIRPSPRNGGGANFLADLQTNDQPTARLASQEKIFHRNNNDGKLLFNLKITDLTTSDNPFVFYENQQVDSEGYLLFSSKQNEDSNQASLNKRKPLPKASIFKSYNNLHQFGSGKNSFAGIETDNDEVLIGAIGDFANDQTGKNSLNPTVMLPWLQKPSDLEKRTLKIEVTFKGELILLRIIHIDKLYPIQYPMIALRIANNMIQNNLLREKNILVSPTHGGDQQPVRGQLHISAHIQDAHNIGKRLTKASSVATYDTDHTRQILKASGGIDHRDVTSFVKQDDSYKDTDHRLKVQQETSPQVASVVISPAERSQIVMKTKSSARLQIQNQKMINNNAPDSVTNMDSKNSILIRTDLVASQFPDLKQALSVKQRLNGINEIDLSVTNNNGPISSGQGRPSLTNLLQPSVSGQAFMRQQPRAISNMLSQRPQIINKEKLAIHRIQVQSRAGQQAFYYKITPQKNEILDILQQLERFDLNVMDVAAQIQSKHLLQFPEVMKHLQLIIEFGDCITQGKDLLNHNIVIDENQQRVQHALMKEQALNQGLPNQGCVKGIQCSPQKVPSKVDGIIRENIKTASSQNPERTSLVKQFIKSNAANYLVLRNTTKTLSMINEVQKQNKPICAQKMRSKKDQFNFLQGSQALNTSALTPQQRSSKAKTVGRKGPNKVMLQAQAQMLNIINENLPLATQGFNSGTMPSPTGQASTKRFTSIQDQIFTQSLRQKEIRDNEPQTATLKGYSISRLQGLNGGAKGGTRNEPPISDLISGTLGINADVNASMSVAQSMRNLINSSNQEDQRAPQAVYCKDQIVVTQGLHKDDIRFRNKSNSHIKGAASKHIESLLNKRQTTLPAQTRQGLTNSDLDVLKDPNTRLNINRQDSAQNSANNLQIDQTIKDLLPIGTNTSTVRQSDEFPRGTSLFRPRQDSDPQGSGPVTYLSKYQQNSVPNSLATLPQVQNTTTNYGLVPNQLFTPIVQEMRESAMNQSWGSTSNINTGQGSKLRHQSVLQHQNYGEQSIQSKGSPQKLGVQSLAPVSNYLYRGSNARKTVRQLLDAKQEFDATVLYEALTHKKFDVPVTRQNFSHTPNHYD